MALRKSRSTSRTDENKRKAARDAVKRLGDKRDEYEAATGYGPGDAYIGLWDAIVDLVVDRKATAKSISHAKAKGPAAKLAARRD
jgi:hypothetical protein